MTQKRGTQMNALTAFSNRQEALLAQLEEIKDMDQAVFACTMALEQVACELAQDEQDDLARQRQQAVMACARRMPQMLRACTARGELVLENEGKELPLAAREKLLRGAKAIGVFLLAALAVYEVIEGRTAFAALQLAGAALFACGGAKAQTEIGAVARGIPCIDAQTAVRMLREICQAVDICVSDLMLLEREAGFARLSGTADEAMLDLLVSQLEAKASGRAELAMRSLDRAEQYLHMLGVKAVYYSTENEGLFDVLPTMGEARTIRPALVKDGQVIRRGTAALQMERGESA